MRRSMYMRFEKKKNLIRVCVYDRERMNGRMRWGICSAITVWLLNTKHDFPKVQGA